jgi:UDP-N-acetylmuramyl tripeptide synthase
METIETEGKFIKIILVKNPIGFNQVINHILTEDKQTNIAFIINDHTADGCDISWLWDVDFEKFENFQSNVTSFITSGTRSGDMTIRLKYAGIFNNKIINYLKFDELIEFGLSQTPKNHNLYILPTYTAMLDIRAYLSKKYHLKEFWK